MNKKKTVLFICTHNSARSQMAEGLLRYLYGDTYDVESAGTEATRVNPFAIEALADIGIDISSHRSKTIDEFQNQLFDIVVTVCDHANETCPFFPTKGKKIHKGFNDPSNTKGTDEEILQSFKTVRDEIKKWIVDEFKPNNKN
jgi:arsenate reductase